MTTTGYPYQTDDGERYRVAYYVRCPGCRDQHEIPVSSDRSGQLSLATILCHCGRTIHVDRQIPYSRRVYQRVHP